MVFRNQDPGTRYVCCCCDCWCQALQGIVQANPDPQWLLTSLFLYIHVSKGLDSHGWLQFQSNIGIIPVSSLFRFVTTFYKGEKPCPVSLAYFLICMEPLFCHTPASLPSLNSGWAFTVHPSHKLEPPFMLDTSVPDHCCCLPSHVGPSWSHLSSDISR